MSNEVENKVVSMTFDNSKFASKMEDTLRGLRKLREELKMTESVKGMKNVASDLNKLDTSKPIGMLGRLKAAIGEIKSRHTDLDLSKATKFDSNKAVGGITRVKEAIGSLSASNAKVDLTPIGDQADGISKKFVAMAAVVGGVIGGIVAQAGAAAGRFASGFFGPITQGFGEFETNMGSIQTILANTDRYGTTLPEVSANLDELNEYSDKTIYNFGEMVKNIGLFTNAGIRIEDATSMIKGFSNAAAASGTTAEGAAGAAYQLSQALSNGKVTLMDWKSLTNVGMGNKNMQQGLIELAGSMGTLETAGVSADEVAKGFNASLETGWLSADVMSNYLKIMAGDMDRAEMATMGLSSAQIDWFERQQTIAEDAATKVRTFTQLVGTIKESIGSGWSETFRNIVGTFDEGTALFTGINKAVGDIVGNMAKARNDLLAGWKAFGGRNDLIDGFKNVWKGLISVINPIRLALRTIFPRTTVKQLLDITAKFKEFTSGLTASGGTVMKIFRIFTGFFSILKVGWAIIKGVARVFGAFFKAIAGGGDGVGVLSFLANIMDFFTWLGKGAVDGGPIEKFFDVVVGAVSGASAVIQPVAKFLLGIFGSITGFIWDVLVGAFNFFSDNIVRIASVLKAFWDILASGVDFVRDKIDAFGGVLARIFGPAAEAVKMGATAIIEAIQSAYRGFMSGATSFKDAAASVGNTILGVFGDIGGSLSSVVNTMKQKATEIGGAIFDGVKETIVGRDWFGMIMQAGRDLYEGFMTSIDAHSPSRVFIDAAKSIPEGIAAGIRAAWGAIKDAMTWVVDRIRELFGGIGDAIASENFDKVFNAGLIAGLLKIMHNLSSFPKSFADIINPKELQRMMKSIRGVFDDFGNVLTGFSRKLKAEALKEVAISVAILAASMIALSFIDADKLQQSGVAMGAALTAITTSLLVLDKFTGTGKKLIAISAAMGLMAGAMFLMGFAITKLGSIDGKTLGQGLGVIAGALLAFTLVMRFMGDQNENVAKAGLAILLISGAMWVMGAAVEKMGKLDFWVIVRGLTGVAGSMTILITAMRNMAKKDMTKAGLGMLLLALSLRGLAKAVTLFGGLGFWEMAQGLLGLGVALTAVVIAMNKMPADMLVKAFAMGVLGLALLAIAGVIAIFGKMDLDRLAQGMIALALALGVITLAATLMGGSAAGAASMLLMAVAIKLLTESINQLGQLKWQELALGIGAIVVALLTIGAVTAILGIVSPLILAFGVALAIVGVGVLALGAGVALLAEGLIQMLKVGRDGMPILIAMILDFLIALPQMLKLLVGAVLVAIDTFLAGIPGMVDKFSEILKALLQLLIKNTPKFFKWLGTLLDGLISLLREKGPAFIDAGVQLVMSLLTAIGEEADAMAEKAVEIVLGFLEGLATAIEENSERIGQVGRDLAQAMLDGIINIFVPSALQEAISNLVTGMVDWFKSLLGINSPSTVFLGFGGDILQGLLDGLNAAIGGIWNFFISLPGKVIEWVGDVTTWLWSKGKDFIAGLLGGLVEKIEEVKTWFTGLSGRVFEWVGDVSTKLYDKGFSFIKGLAKGITDRAQSVKKWFTEFPGNLIDAIGEVGEKFGEVGSAIVEGILQGIKNGWGSVKNWVSDAAGGLVSGVKSVFGINSPSKVFREIGEMVMKGLLLGLDDDGKVLRTAENMSNDVVDNLRSTFSRVPGILEEVGDINPTITPVLDLTNVKMGADQIASLLSGGSISPDVSLDNARLISAAGTPADNESVEAVRSGDVTYVQNNYSPKALSTADIYRNTKGQIARAKEELGIAS